MVGTQHHPFGQILEQTAVALDVTAELHDRVEQTHQEVGEWLGGEDSPLHSLDVKVYPHGSFRLGTVIRPLTDDDFCDVDTVCRVRLMKDTVTRRDLKQMVGDRLKESKEYQQILEECRTCWTLHFDEHFRMDILPAIPDQDRQPNGILITDKEWTRWLVSNPIAYAEWFKSRMLAEHERLINAHRADVERIPEWRIKTALQRAVQLLKRHRDIRFKDEDHDHRPLSIIITTLAAKSYNNEASLINAMERIVRTMGEHIEVRHGEYWVENPVNAQENFADSWNEEPRKREVFFEWLEVLESDFEQALIQRGLDKVKLVLANAYGQGTVERAYERVARATLDRRTNGDLLVTPVTGVLTLDRNSGIAIPPHRNFGDAPD